LSPLRRILKEHPEARPQIKSAVVSLLVTALATIVAVGMLLIWHMRRRAQLIRDRLGPPRKLSFPDLPEKPRDQERPPTVPPDGNRD
jgi:hypothetical protein